MSTARIYIGMEGRGGGEGEEGGRNMERIPLHIFVLVNSKTTRDRGTPS